MLAVVGVGELAFVLFDVYGRGAGISLWSAPSIVVGYLVTALLWVAGGILMFRCASAGKFTLVVLSVLGIANGLADILYNLQYGQYVRTATALLTMILASVVLTLCLVPATRRWLTAGPPGALYGTSPAGRPASASLPMGPGSSFPGPPRPPH